MRTGSTRILLEYDRGEAIAHHGVSAVANRGFAASVQRAYL
jgi:hypothetical protein